MRFFLDTNIVLYAMYESQNPDHTRKATRLFSKGAHISTQVISESVSASQRKFGADFAASQSIVDGLIRNFTVVQITTGTIRLALEVQKLTEYSYYDSQLIAASLEAGCDVFYSEDMQDGRLIFDRLTILNPFL